MDVSLTILRKGESVEENYGDKSIRHAEVTHAVLIEDGTLSDKPSVMLVGENEREVVILELTYQIYDMINGAAHGAFGPPTSEFRVEFEPPR